METARKIVGIPQVIERDVAHARHDAHVEDDIDAVGDLNADFAEGRAMRAHEERDHIHRAAAHGAAKDFAELVVGLRRRHPIIVGSGVVLVLGADKGKMLRARHVVGRAAVQITAGQSLLVQRYQIAALDGDPGKTLFFLLRYHHTRKHRRAGTAPPLL